MNTIPKSAPVETLGLPRGDHWVRFHVEGDSISFQVAASLPPCGQPVQKKPTGFVRKWGGSVKKMDADGDEWLEHINRKHLR